MFSVDDPTISALPFMIVLLNIQIDTQNGSVKSMFTDYNELDVEFSFASLRWKNSLFTLRV
uniref:Uncharacterized protein n=1 Tax=Ascaris lumbricoides TaxID=6252 RepID=A0A0M3IDF4_ASCLU